MTSTNIKNLPEGEYFTEIGYSQSYPWVVVKRTAKTITLARVRVSKDPEWVPEMSVGGFCAHFHNQNEQTWLFDKIDAERKTTIRQTKKGWSHQGVRFIEGCAREFYDYNF